MDGSSSAGCGSCIRRLSLTEDMDRSIVLVMEKETYIGDGVYASFDGEHIWLRVEREGADHRIALNAEAFHALLEYSKRTTRDDA